MEICISIEDNKYERFEHYLADNNLTIKKFVNDEIARCLEENKEELEKMDQKYEEELKELKKLEFETLGKYLAEGDGITEKKRERIKELLKVFYRSLKIYCETKDQQLSNISAILNGTKTCSDEFWGKLVDDSSYFKIFEMPGDNEEKKTLKRMLRKQFESAIDKSILDD